MRIPAVGAPFAVITLLATLGVGMAAMPAAAADCTYTFPRTGGLYTEPVVDGDLLCGGPGPDRVLRLEGGTFLGRGGRDRVWRLSDGTFRGGSGRDRVRLGVLGGTFVGGSGGDRVLALRGGTFVGGNGPDGVADMHAGRFESGHHDDVVVSLHGGTFDGGAGTDEIPVCLDSPPAVHLNLELIATQSCTSIKPARGTPVRSPGRGRGG
jgi:hypothetical protein